jgi:hypothetical protein
MHTQPSLIGIVVHKMAAKSTSLAGQHVCCLACHENHTPVPAGIVFQQGKFGNPLIGCDSHDMDRLTIVPFGLDATGEIVPLTQDTRRHRLFSTPTNRMQPGRKGLYFPPHSVSATSTQTLKLSFQNSPANLRNLHAFVRTIHCFLRFVGFTSLYDL